MQIIIREATLNDAPRLVELNATVQGLHAQAEPRRFKPPTAENPELLALYEQRIQDEHSWVFIAEVNGEAIGYCHYIHQITEENPFTLANSNLQINEISVKESHQGTGVGYALMQHAESFAKELGVSQVSLGVWAFNEKAINFYKRLGFEVASLKMRKSLTNTLG